MRQELTLRYGNKHLQDGEWVRTGWVEWGTAYRLEFVISEAGYQTPGARKIYEQHALDAAEMAFGKLAG